jgi:hypothetical protein
VALLSPDGRVTVVWQQSEGADARILIAQSTETGDFALPTSLQGLPAGASRPIPLFTTDGTLHLVFQAPLTPLEGADVRAAVFYASSRDGGVSTASVTRLSPLAIDAGEADLIIRGNTLHAVFRAGPTWQSQILHTLSHNSSQTWSTPVSASPDDLYAEYPSLYPHVDGSVGLEFYGNNRGQPSGRSALKRFTSVYETGTWAAPRRVLTHFPAVTAAWLQVNFHLRSAREHYRPHDLTILLNEQALINQKGVIPEGTYLLPFDPALLRAAENGLPRNVIGLRTRHMDQAHYMNVAGFRLQARHRVVERLVVAENQQEADAIGVAESPRLNHSRADVGLFNNEAASLPATPAPGEIITLPLLVANLGEAPAEGIRLDVYTAPPPANGQPPSSPIGKSITVGRLEPFTVERIVMQFPYGGAEHYYIVARIEGVDFDPRNNVHMVSFSAPKPPHIPPVMQDAAQELAITVVDDPEPPYLWRILDAGDGHEVARVEQGRLSGPLPSGQYRLALTRFQFEGQEVFFPQAIAHRAGEKRRLAVRTAIEIATPGWPKPRWRWEVVKADQPDDVVQWHYSTHPVMLVPPGEYQMAIRPMQFAGTRLLWPQTIRLNEDQHAILTLDSGIKLAVGSWVPKLDPTHGWWGVVPTGEPPATPLHWARSEDKLLLPPGSYDVHWVQDWDHRTAPLPLARGVKVEQGQATVVQANAGVRLAMAFWLLERAKDGWWGVVQAGEPPAKPLHWTNTADVLVLPPGQYDVYWVQGYSQTESPLLLASAIEVTPDQLTSVDVQGSVRLWSKTAGALRTLADLKPAWVAGDLPTRAQAIGDWVWHEEPAFGVLRSHAGKGTEGPSLHYFIRAQEPLSIDTHDNLVQYVYLDPKARPKQILLQLYTEGAQGDHRVYWGENLIDLGDKPGTTSLFYAEPLPQAGAWVRLRIPIERFGLEKARVTGILYGHYDGRAFWGPTTKSPRYLDDAPESLIIPRGSTNN